MASAHINIEGNSTRLNRELRQFVDRLQQIVDDAGKMKATYDQLALGEDWIALRDALGLEPDANGEADATTIYNLFGSVNSELGGTFIAQLLSRLG